MIEKIGTRILYDTSALIEFFLASLNGERVKELFLSEEIENLIPSVVFTELVGKLKRSNKNPTKFVSLLEENSTVVELDLETAKKAGEIYAILKPNEANISSIDCIIIAHAELADANIITKDHHFKNYKKSIILE